MVSVDGVQISLASKDGDNGDREAGSALTTNFVNVGQVIQISRDHNTVVMMGNKFHVTQQIKIRSSPSIIIIIINSPNLLRVVLLRSSQHVLLRVAGLRCFSPL